MKILEKEFTGAVKKFCEILCGKSKNEKCHRYGHFNNLMAKKVGTADIREETLLNTKEYAVAVKIKKFIIEQINFHVDKRTDGKEAYRLIEKSVQEKFNEFKSDV